MVMSNISGNMYRIIFNMYNNIKSCQSYNSGKSEYFPCEIGENLYSFLFSLFLNDLEENVIGLKTISGELENKLNIYLKLFVILYADDTVLMAESDSDLQTPFITIALLGK